MRIRNFTILALVTLGACSSPPVLSVDPGYVRLAAVPRRPAVAYFTIHGGVADATLIAVNTDVAVKSELHESMQAGGMATMKPLGDVAVPARSSVVFKPGGKHLMLFDMNPGIHPPRAITLTFTFANGQRILVDEPTIAAGAPAPTQ